MRSRLEGADIVGPTLAIIAAGGGEMQPIARLAAVALLALAAPAFAQFPAKPITLICPWPPGGTTDVHLRKFAEIAQKYLGQRSEERRVGKECSSREWRDNKEKQNTFSCLLSHEFCR